MGIVNAGQLIVYEDIPKDLLEHVEDIIFNRRPDATERLVQFAETVKGSGDQARGRSEVARQHRGGAALARARARRARFPRARPRGGPAEVRAAARDHRRPADGRHESGRRSVRRRQDVPAAGGEERPRDEEGRRVPDAVHGRGKGARAEGGHRHARAGQDPDGHRQGRRPRHRQEHRRRRARLQQLRGHRPRRDGADRQDPADRDRREGRHGGPERAHHAVARRNGVRGARDGAPRLHAAAAHRRRHDQQAAYGGENRAGLRKHDGARARRIARGGRGVDAAESGEDRRSSMSRTRRSRPTSASSTRAVRGVRCSPYRDALANAPEAGVDGRSGAVIHRPALSGRRAARRHREVHRLDAVLLDVGAEGIVSRRF